jgi:hypothetical protein
VALPLVAAPETLAANVLPDTGPLPAKSRSDAALGAPVRRFTDRVPLLDMLTVEKSVETLTLDSVV